MMMNTATTVAPYGWIHGMCWHGMYTWYLLAWQNARRFQRNKRHDPGPSDHASAGKDLVLKIEVHAEASGENQSLLRVVCTVTLRIVTNTIVPL